MFTVKTGPGGTGSATKSRQDSDGKDDEEKTKMRGEREREREILLTHCLEFKARVLTRYVCSILILVTIIMNLFNYQ